MLMLLYVIIMMMVISILLMLFCLIISKKSIQDREKMSPFECGFDLKSSPRMPFSSMFFLIAVLFLIFDIEIVIILPMIITIKLSNMLLWLMNSYLFLVILLLGLYHEWNNNILNWTS